MWCCLNVKVFFQFADIKPAHFAEHSIFPDDAADLHNAVRAVRLKRHSEKIRAVKLLTDDARAKSVPIKTDHKIEHSCTVAGLYGAQIVGGAEYLLGKIKRAALTLLKGQTRIVKKLFKAYGAFICKRVTFP